MDLARAYPLFAWAGFAIVAKASRRHAPLEPQSVGLNLLPRRSVSLRVACFTGSPAARDLRTTSTFKARKLCRNLGEAEKPEAAVITRSAPTSGCGKQDWRRRQHRGY